MQRSVDLPVGTEALSSGYSRPIVGEVTATLFIIIIYLRGLKYQSGYYFCIFYKKCIDILGEIRNLRINT